MLAHIWGTVTTTTSRASLAAAMHVGLDEIAIVRNATEALDTVLLGVPLRSGDEVICSRHDYYAMLDAAAAAATEEGARHLGAGHGWHSPRTLAIRAVRVSPNVYATQAEIDRFGRALASTVSALSA